MNLKFLCLLLLVALASVQVEGKKKKKKDMLADFNPKSEGGEGAGGEDKESAAGDGGDDDDDEDEDWFDTIDPSSVGKKDCTNNEEVEHCVGDCEGDKDCSATSQESQCEQDCLIMCKYIEHYRDRKCVNHMVVHLSWYRDFGGAGAGKSKIKPTNGDKKAPKRAPASPQPAAKPAAKPRAAQGLILF